MGIFKDKYTLVFSVFFWDIKAFSFSHMNKLKWNWLLFPETTQCFMGELLCKLIGAGFKNEYLCLINSRETESEHEELLINDWLVVSFLPLSLQLINELAAMPVPTATPPLRSIYGQIVPLVLRRCIAPCAINSTCNVNPAEIFCVSVQCNFNILGEVQGVRRIGLQLHSHWLDVMLQSWIWSYNDVTTLTYTNTEQLDFIALGWAEFPPSIESFNTLLLKIWIKFNCIHPCGNMRWNRHLCYSYPLCILHSFTWFVWNCFEQSVGTQ